MGRYSVRLAPVVRRLRRHRGGPARARRRRGHRCADGRARPSRRRGGRGRPLAAVRRRARAAVCRASRCGRRRPRSSRGPTSRSMRRSRSSCVTFMNDAPAGVAEMRRVVRPGGVVAVCMWDRTAWRCSRPSIARSRPSRASRRRPRRARSTGRARRSRASSPATASPTCETELWRSSREYAGYDELWGTLVDGAGPAGAWIKSLDDEQPAAAREELRRQVGDPAGAFSLRGRAWATRATRA